MAILSREFTFGEMREHRMPYWKIYQGKTLIAKCSNINDVDLQIEKLNEKLNQLSSTNAYVDVKVSAYTNDEISEGNPKAKQGFIHTIQLNKDIKESPMQINGISQSNVDSLIEIERKKHEFEIEKLKFSRDVELQKMRDEIVKLREEFMNDDDEDDSINGIESIIKEVKPYLPMILSNIGFIPKSNAMSEDVSKIVVEDESTKMSHQDEQVRKISNACNRILKIDKNAGDNLMKLALFVELSPDAYFQFIPMIEMQIDILKSKQNGGQ